MSDAISIWDQQVTSHQEPGSFGEALQKFLADQADLAAQRPNP